MKQCLELTTSENAALKRLESQAQLWLAFRWVGLAGSVTLAGGGGWGTLLAYRAAARLNSFASPALLAATLAGWSAVIIGFVLFTHIIARWRSSEKDRLLIKLLKANAAE